MCLLPCRSRCHVFEEFIVNWDERLREQDATMMTVKLQKDVNIYKVRCFSRLRIVVLISNFCCNLKSGNIIFQKSKSNLRHPRGITPKRVMIGESDRCGLAPGQHSSKRTSQWWRVVVDTGSDLVGPEIEPMTSRANSNVR